MRQILRFAIGLPVCGLLACTTTQKPVAPDNLDVPLPSNTTTATSETSVVPIAAVVEWQRFFKPPPGPKERSLLEKKLATWRDAGDAASLVTRGRNELALGRNVNAEVSFREALRLDEKNLEALLELAQIALRRRDTGTAFELLAQLRDLFAVRDKIEAGLLLRYRYTLAVAHILRGERDRGHEILSEIISTEKAFAPAYNALASSYLAVGKVDLAEFIAKRGIDRTKEDPGLNNLLGALAERRGKEAEAEEWYNKALSLAPAFVPAIINRANLQLKHALYKDAEDDLHKALLYSPGDADAWVSLGLCRKHLKDFAGAQSSFMKAIDFDPDHAAARYNLAVLLAENLKEKADALRLFHEVLQTRDSNAPLKEQARLYIDELEGNENR